jgi:ADP-glucose pyrophosphorylase
LKQGEKISNLKNASQKSYSFTFDYLQKNFEKNLQKNLQKQKCGASVVQNVKNKETIHAYLMKIFIVSILSNHCTYILQTSSIMHFYTCFGLCWHQSPKRGRLKGN